MHKIKKAATVARRRRGWVALPPTNSLPTPPPPNKKLVPLVPAGHVHTKTSEASKKEEYQRRSIGHLRARATCGEGGQRKNLPNLFFCILFSPSFPNAPATAAARACRSAFFSCACDRR